MRAAWQGLAERERRLIWVAGALLLVLLLWLLLWRPIAAERERLRSQVAVTEATLVWLNSVSGNLSERAPGHQLQNRGQRSLLALADASAREAGLGEGLSRVEPAGDGRVRVWLEDVPFDTVITWLESLAGSYGVETEELSLERAQVLGAVSGRVQLRDLPGAP